MNRERKIKEVEEIIGNTTAWICLHLEVASVILDDVKPKLATAIVDSMEIDKEKFSKWLLDNGCVKKEVDEVKHPYLYLKTLYPDLDEAFTSDIIKIKE